MLSQNKSLIHSQISSSSKMPSVAESLANAEALIAAVAAASAAERQRPLLPEDLERKSGQAVHTWGQTLQILNLASTTLSTSPPRIRHPSMWESRCATTLVAFENDRGETLSVNVETDRDLRITQVCIREGILSQAISVDRVPPSLLEAWQSAVEQHSQ